MARRDTSAPSRRRDAAPAMDGRQRLEDQAALYRAPDPLDDAADDEPDERLQPRRAVGRREDFTITAEQAVIGALLTDPGNYWQVRLQLQPEDFLREDHKRIFRAIGEMTTAEPPIAVDAVTVAERFESQGVGVDIVDPGYLIHLQTTTPSAANVLGYASVVLEKSRFRKLANEGANLLRAASHPEGRTSDEVMADAVSAIETLDRRQEAQGQPFAQSLVGVKDWIAASMTGTEDQLPGLRFGFPELENKIGGLEPGKLYMIGANTKVGKSILMANIAEGLARNGHATGEWHLEMSERQLGFRRISSWAGIPHEHIRRPKMLEELEWERLQVAMRELRDAPMTVFHDPSASIEKITAQAVMLKARGKLLAVFVDYLQIMRVTGKKDRRDLEVAHNTWGLKMLAKRLDVPVISAAQVNRKNQEGTTIRPPRPSDLRESGSIEQDVDVLLLLHRPSAHDSSQRGAGLRCEIALNRDGETGVIRLDEDLERQRFLNSDHAWVDQQHEKGGSYSSSGFD